ncbi:hypothetical protein ABG067_008275 [Albugo candida]
MGKIDRMLAKYRDTIVWKNATGAGIMRAAVDARGAAGIDDAQNEIDAELKRRCKYFFEIHGVYGDSAAAEPPHPSTDSDDENVKEIMGLVGDHDDDNHDDDNGDSSSSAPAANTSSSSASAASSSSASVASSSTSSTGVKRSRPADVLHSMLSVNEKRVKIDQELLLLKKQKAKAKFMGQAKVELQALFDDGIITLEQYNLERMRLYNDALL